MTADHTAVSARTVTAMVALAAIVGVVAGLPSAAFGAPSCREDGDCSGVLLCRAARCVPVQCRDDSHCPAGRMCRDELCRIRQCYEHADCTIDRRCQDGSCVTPPPRVVREPVVPGDLRFAAGPCFPLGVQVTMDVPLGDNRWVLLGIGSTIGDGGVSWKLGLRGAPVPWRSLRLDAWAAVMGLNVDALDAAGEPGLAPALDIADVLQGSARTLFAADRDVSALWWGAGVGITLPHGTDSGRLLRLDIGALLLFDDSYPVERDFSVLPLVGLSYGVTVPPSPRPPAR